MPTPLGYHYYYRNMVNLSPTFQSKRFQTNAKKLFFSLPTTTANAELIPLQQRLPDLVSESTSRLPPNLT